MGAPATLLDDTLRSASECRLVTVGRTSRQPRRTVLWFAALEDRLFALAGNREKAHWVRNIRADPRVEVTIDGRSFEGRARVVEGEPEDRLARQVVGAKYGRKWLSRWLSESLPVAIDLEREIPRV